MEHAYPLFNKHVTTQLELTTLFLDIDHFKTINDNYGHACGDQVLSTVANALKSQTRNDDILARWGGEEFLFSLADVTSDEAINIADALRLYIQQLSFECNNKINRSYYKTKHPHK